MVSLVRSVAFVLLGYVVAKLANVNELEDSGLYLTFVAVLLAVGLYGSTYGIDHELARRDRRTIIAAVTIGVLLKAALVGTALALAFQDPVFLLLAVVVAQIDPLSVAALMDDPRMSPRAKSILASWASFDDPITVILTVYVSAVVLTMQGDSFPIGERPDQGSALAAYGLDLGLNLLIAGAAYLLWRYLRDSDLSDRARTLWTFALLGVVLTVGVWQFLMLAIALAGLFLRPAIDRFIGHAVNIAMALASVGLGFLLVQGLNPWRGLALGLAAYVAQVIVGMLMTWKLPETRDRIHIAFAQQNGITAIILALLLEPSFPGTVAVVAPAIFIINVTHFAVNKVIDRRHQGADEAAATAQSPQA